MLRGAVLVFLNVLLVSCDYFKSEQELAEERVWAALNDDSWDTVDSYPLFDVCPEQESLEAMRGCFEQTLIVYLASAIEGLSYEIEEDMNERVFVDFTIDPDGFINLDQIETNPTVERLLPSLKEDLQASFSNLFASRNAVTVSPAIKRGQYVGIKVRLPIILRT